MTQDDFRRSLEQRPCLCLPDHLCERCYMLRNLPAESPPGTGLTQVDMFILGLLVGVLVTLGGTIFVLMTVRP